jgi:ABC-type nitrate/sulfonate/bicarbonate transport system substrate-binding protein
MFWLYARPEIRNVKELAGKRVAVSSLGAAGDSALRELIKKNGMDENRDVAILAIGTPATRLGALSTRTVDAAMMIFPHNITAAEHGLRELVSFIASDIIQLQGAIVTRDALLQSDPALVETFLRHDPRLDLLFNQPERRCLRPRAQCEIFGGIGGEGL